MSGRKSSSAKITLGMLKGKSITTSVPTFSVRFHAEDEELQGIYPNTDETDEDAEKQEEESNSSAGGTQITTAAMPTAVTTSTSATTSTIHSRDPSPMKEYFKGFGKRSTSVDAGMIDGGSPATGSDTWRLFHEIKGKIAKTVEEKFGEMKSDRRSSSLVFSGGSNMRGGRLVGGGGSKDDSSVNSDSEDISESSNKGQDTKPAVKKDIKEEGSPKRITICFDTNRKDEDSINCSSAEIPGTSASHDVGNLSAPVTPKKSKKEVLSTTTSLLRNRKNEQAFRTSSQDNLVLDETESYKEEEVESGVEVNEEMNLNIIKEDDTDIPTTDYRNPLPVTFPPLPPRQRRKKSLLSKLRYWGVKLLPLIGILIYYMIPLPPYISGFINGIAISIGVGAVYTWIARLTVPSHQPDSDASGLQIENFSIPDYSKMPILEVPAVKEYHQINKYQGWMNEYRHEYNPEAYHLSDTQSVYIRLEGSTLRISHTKLRIPKRAMWNERPHKLKFYHQRIYSIENCTLKLLPDGLARRRVWSKKYPICILLNRNAKVRFEDILESRERQDEEESSQKVTEPITDEIFDELPDQPSSQQSKSEAVPDEEDDSADTYNQMSEVKDLNDTSDIPIDESDDETFCHIDKCEMMEECLYLFARTDREKEDWYRRFATATRQKLSSESNEDELVTSIPEVSSPPVVSPTSSDENLSEALSDSSVASQTTASGQTATSLLQPGHIFMLPTNEFMAVKSFEARDFEYLRFMSKFQQVQRYKMNQFLEWNKYAAPKHDPSYSPPIKSEANRKKPEKMDATMEAEMVKEIDADVMWINAMIGRVLFDILKNPCWIEKLQERLQRKLSTIKLPYFIEDLLISDLDLGHNLPLAHRVSHPRLDERGLWIDLDVTYDGTACFTLETKLNLMKLKQVGGEIAAAQALAEKDEISLGEKSKSPMYDSDMDDSAESSEDEDEGKSTSGEEKTSPPPPSAGKKLMKVVNKIAASKYFQQATEYKYIKKAIEGVSNTKLMLTLEVNGLVGTLAVNIPPPPSDRLWYGFRGNPRLWLQARPKLGERQVNISQVTSWIEKQLCSEFQKKFVLPNMDDIVIPPMTTQLPD